MMIMTHHPQQQQQPAKKTPLHIGRQKQQSTDQMARRQSQQQQQQQQPQLKQRDFLQTQSQQTQARTTAAKLGSGGSGTSSGATSAATKSSTTTTTQHHPEQDGKRTLIKNQLYLIEQLQLENASLRNERDQLQLENEELKFQLQMISSSNIVLSQPGSTFNDQSQLERLVESSSKLNERHHPLAPSAVGGAASVSAATATTANLTTRASGSSTATATAVTAAVATTSAGTPAQLQAQQQTTPNHQIRLLTTALRRPPLRIISDGQQSQQQQQQQQQSLRNALDQTSSISILASNAANKFICPKSSTLVGLNAKQHATTSVNSCSINQQQVPQSRTLPQDDEEQRRVELVEQCYGDREQVRAAAIIIQRTFRKYQICKRFRTITEQLRHTHQNQSSSLVAASSGICSGQALVSYEPQSNDRRRCLPLDGSTSVGSTRPISSNSTVGLASGSVTTTATTTNIAAITTKTIPSDVLYASGTTRAAAWESLSYAASRLAANAAASAASAVGKQANGHTKPIQSQSQPQTQPSQQVQPIEKQHPVVASAVDYKQLESIRKRQYRVGLHIFNKSPEKGVSFLVAHSFIDSSAPYSKSLTGYYYSSNQLQFMDKQHQLPLQQTVGGNGTATGNNSCQLCCEEDTLKRNVAYFLLHRKGLAKEKIGQYLGNLQSQFNQDVLKYYLQESDFNGLRIDLALRKFLSTFRLPGEAQKIERIVDCFAQRFVQCQQLQLQQQLTGNPSGNSVAQIQFQAVLTKADQTQHQQQHQQHQQHQQQHQQQGGSNYNKNNLILLSKDEIFILTFAIIMLNTDLHSPSLKPTSRMSASQFVNNLRGVFKSQNINESDLIEIYERVKANQITTTPDHVTHVMKVQQGLTVTNFQKKELPNLCVPHRRLVSFCRLFEVYDVNKKERVGQHQRELFLFNDLLLVTKLTRRAKANTTQLYTYRQSISLQGLYVHPFQSTHYNFGIRLCQRSNDETIIMFNARNELDQSRFANDLGESIAEMDEMDAAKTHNIIEIIHFKYLDRLRRHSTMHNNTSADDSAQAVAGNGNHQQQHRETKGLSMMNNNCDTIRSTNNTTITNTKQQLAQSNQNDSQQGRAPISASIPKPSSSASTVASANKNYQGTSTTDRNRKQTKFNSMMNLSNSTGSDCGGNDDYRNNNDDGDDDAANKNHGRAQMGLRVNESFAQQPKRIHQLQQQQPSGTGILRGDNQLVAVGSVGIRGTQQQQQQQYRRRSTGSAHSLDSGLFLSRDVSPNQSS